MSANSYGEIFKITTFGESHGKAVGVIVDGCPAGVALSEGDIQPDLDRRRPGQSHITTQRDEKDRVEILSGVFEGKTTGTPISLIVFNQDQKSNDYDALKNLVRPGHADYTYNQKYGNRDPRGGGRSSARIMIARVAAGAIAKKFLKEKLGVEFLAYTESVGDIKMENDAIRTLKGLTINTERLSLIPTSFKFFDQIYAEFTSEITTYMYPAPYKNEDVLAGYLNEGIDSQIKGKNIQLIITNKFTGEFYGRVFLQGIDSPTPEFGIWIKKSAHSKGYGREAVLGLKLWADDNLQFDYLLYPVDRRNTQSEKIALALGGALKREFTEVNDSGKLLEFKEYRILPKNNPVNSIYKSYDDVTQAQIESNIVRCPDPETAEKMIKLIEQVRKDEDSIGGVIRGLIRNLPIGLGEPEFDKLPAELAKAMMSINATKGFEIGSGFEGTKLRGSQHNDIFYTDKNGNVKTKTNHSGGVLGGISNGQTIDFRVAIKPVATISQAQDTIDKDGKKVVVEGKGRHDPCVLPRAVPIVEAMAALVIMDMYLRNQARG